MTAPLEGIKVVDMTEVQSGPSCTQFLAWLGAEVIKIERPGGGDPTRSEMQDIPGEDSLYYLQLNANKKSLTLNAKTPEGKKIMTDLIKDADIFVENLHPGAIEHLGFGWDQVHKINPKCIMGSIKGFNPVSRFANIKAFEPVAQCAGGAAAATGWYDGPDNKPTQSGAALGDSNTGMHLLIGLLAALRLRDKTGEGTYVYQSMQNAVLNLCRIKLRDQLCLDRLHELPWYSCWPNYKWGDSIPRPANAEGGLVMGWCYRCKGWETDPSAYVYIVLQNELKAFTLAAQGLGHPEWATDPKYNTPAARNKIKQEIYAEIEKFTMTMTKEEVVQHLSKFGVPVGPVLSWKEIETDPELRADGTIPSVAQGGKRGDFLTIGLPMFFSNFKPNITRAPALGENNAEILARYGYTTPEQLDALRKAGVIQ
jgi:formyl-CoA transferase